MADKRKIILQEEQDDRNGINCIIGLVPITGWNKLEYVKKCKPEVSAMPLIPRRKSPRLLHNLRFFLIGILL